MNELTSLGLILLFALLVGHLVKVGRIPEVTGYLVAGILVGPSALGWVTQENLEALRVFSEVGLGLILFSIGGVFEIGRMRRVGRRVLLLTLSESGCAAALVTVGMVALGQTWPVAMLLAAIAVATGAASTLMVVRENNAEGEFTEAVIGVIGLNNILALVLFSLVAAVIELTAMATTGFDPLSVTRALFPLLWQLAGSSALGFLVGLVLATWASQVVESGETLILVAGCILLTVGLSAALGLSSLVTCLSVGATLVNLSPRSRRLFVALSHTDPPLYVIFFVLAGAELNLALLPSLGVVGATYVITRTGGKLIGAWLAAWRLRSSTVVRQYLGLSILAQAGLAVGLVLVTRQRFPDLAPIVSTVVLGAVAVFEVAGPLSARFALDRSGESRPEPDVPVPLEL